VLDDHGTLGEAVAPERLVVQRACAPVSTDSNGRAITDPAPYCVSYAILVMRCSAAERKSPSRSPPSLDELGGERVGRETFSSKRHAEEAAHVAQAPASGPPRWQARARRRGRPPPPRTGPSSLARSPSRPSATHHVHFSPPIHHPPAAACPAPLKSQRHHPHARLAGCIRSDAMATEATVPSL